MEKNDRDNRVKLCSLVTTCSNLKAFLAFSVLARPPQAACCKAAFFSAFRAQFSFNLLIETVLITCPGGPSQFLPATSLTFGPC